MYFISKPITTGITFSEFVESLLYYFFTEKNRKKRKELKYPKTNTIKRNYSSPMVIPY